MGHLDDVANGVQLALDATLARLGGESDRLIELLNVSTPPELAQAVAYLADCYQSSLVDACGGDRAAAIAAFRNAIAEGAATGDIIRSQVRLMESGGDDL